MAADKYRRIRPDKIIETQGRLQKRIADRFPKSGLSEVAAELQDVAEKAALRAEAIRRPIVWLRAIVAGLLLGLAAILMTIIRNLRVDDDLENVIGFVQFIEAFWGAAVFVGVTVLFLVTLEIRLKRRRALAAIHELRAIAHVVDMHQVTKDPEGLMRRGPIKSQDSEQTTKTLFDLNRYLNYCNELLAIISKIAAVYVQEFPDAPTVSAVDQVENLCSGLSQRIWQKITIFEDVLGESKAEKGEA